MSQIEIIENGRKFKQIKYRESAAGIYLKPKAQNLEGDIFKECSDGWFINERTRSRVNILAIEDYQKYYEEIL